MTEQFRKIRDAIETVVSGEVPLLDADEKQEVGKALAMFILMPKADRDAFWKWDAEQDRNTYEAFR